MAGPLSAVSDAERCAAGDGVAVFTDTAVLAVAQRGDGCLTEAGVRCRPASRRASARMQEALMPSAVRLLRDFALAEPSSRTP
jgi:hypothetical protein